MAGTRKRIGLVCLPLGFTYREVILLATSRTGTARWKTLVTKAIAEAFANQQFICPLCGVFLDYSRSKQPNSPEVDHIVPYASGGEDTLENTRVICRRCNQSLGGKLGRAKQLKPVVKRVESKRASTSFDW